MESSVIPKGRDCPRYTLYCVSVAQQCDTPRLFFFYILFLYSAGVPSSIQVAHRRHHHDKRRSAIVALDRMNYTFDINVAYVSMHPVARLPRCIHIGILEALPPIPLLILILAFNRT